MKVKGQTTGLIISLHKMVCRWLFHCIFAMRLKMMVFKRAHLLWNTTSVDNGHLRGPLTLTPVAERLAVELSLPFLATSGLSRLGFEHQTFLIRCIYRLRKYHIGASTVYYFTRSIYLSIVPNLKGTFFYII